eukprot:XP_001707588.1 Hypothetical protein GL50803_37655 [Giardia lamblia ATCC 50803]
MMIKVHDTVATCVAVRGSGWTDNIACLAENGRDVSSCNRINNILLCLSRLSSGWGICFRHRDCV